jgi:hypothetical protein
MRSSTPEMAAGKMGERGGCCWSLAVGALLVLVVLAIIGGGLTYYFPRLRGMWEKMERERERQVSTGTPEMRP